MAQLRTTQPQVPIGTKAQHFSRPASCTTEATHLERRKGHYLCGEPSRCRHPQCLACLAQHVAHYNPRRVNPRKEDLCIVARPRTVSRRAVAFQARNDRWLFQRHDQHLVAGAHSALYYPPRHKDYLISHGHQRDAGYGARMHSDEACIIVFGQVKHHAPMTEVIARRNYSVAAQNHQHSMSTNPSALLTYTSKNFGYVILKPLKQCLQGHEPRFSGPQDWEDSPQPSDISAHMRNRLLWRKNATDGSPSPRAQHPRRTSGRACRWTSVLQ